MREEHRLIREQRLDEMVVAEEDRVREHVGMP